tara:strand:- start:1126 stop:2232 length:1107 start_codon:yes stop_codon:yes gene_type:complete
MTVQNPPVFIQAGTHPAEDVRRGFESIYKGYGVVPATITGAGASATSDLKVVQGTGMSVTVQTGQCVIKGDNTYQGMYFCDNRGNQSVLVTAAHATSARIDLIVAKIQDVVYDGGATNAWSLAVVTGAPSASPAVPAKPAHSIVLAQIAVSATATSIVTANITDKRQFATLNGGTTRVTAAPNTVLTAGNIGYTPMSGDKAYSEVDYKTYEYTNAANDFQLPWGLPWGALALSSYSTNQTGISTETDLTSLTGSLPSDYPIGRRYKIRVTCPAMSATSAGTSAAGAYILYIKTSAGVQVASSTWIPPLAGAIQPMFAEVNLTSSIVGTVTYKASLLRFLGSGTGSTGANTNSAATFEIIDLGPASNPS